MKFGSEPHMRKQIQVQFLIVVVVDIMARADDRIELPLVCITGIFYPGYFLEIICHAIVLK